MQFFGKCDGRKFRKAISNHLSMEPWTGQTFTEVPLWLSSALGRPPMAQPALLRGGSPRRCRPAPWCLQHWSRGCTRAPPEAAADLTSAVMPVCSNHLLFRSAPHFCRIQPGDVLRRGLWELFWLFLCSVEDTEVTPDNLQPLSLLLPRGSSK